MSDRDVGILTFGFKKLILIMLFYLYLLTITLLNRRELRKEKIEIKEITKLQKHK